MLSGDEMLAVGNSLSGTPGETHSTEKYCAPAPQRGQTRNGIYDLTRFQEVDAMSATIPGNSAMDCALHAPPLNGAWRASHASGEKASCLHPRDWMFSRASHASDWTPWGTARRASRGADAKARASTGSDGRRCRCWREERASNGSDGRSCRRWREERA